MFNCEIIFVTRFNTKYSDQNISEYHSYLGKKSNDRLKTKYLYKRPILTD